MLRAPGPPASSLTRPTPAGPSAPTCAQRRITATIPEPADQQANRARRGSKGGRRPQFDADIYTQRNCVERAITKLKQFRAVATRYDKRQYIFGGTIDVASIRIWLRDPVP